MIKRIYLLKSAIPLALLAACYTSVYTEESFSSSMILNFLNEHHDRELAPENVVIARVPGSSTRDFYITYLTKTTSCGSGGCTMFVLESLGSRFRTLGKITTVHLPITLLGFSNNGYPRIGAWVEGGGISPGYQVELVYNGNQYPGSPFAPTAQRLGANIKGVVLISRDSSRRVVRSKR